jgi:pimeloyl-ACP methyl ester carboxylesterase
MALLSRLKIPNANVVGHDFGSPVAAYCALTRPDIFKSVVLMSAPFGGVQPPVSRASSNFHEDLKRLGRKHYQLYYSTREADGDMRHCPQGVHAFLRAYYHVKSADWDGNRPFPLKGWIASELAKMPTYYIMEFGKTMAETVAPHMPSRVPDWLSDEELRVYSDSFGKNGFQGGLQWYRCATSPELASQLNILQGKTVDVPAMYIAGASDWGIYQKPGEFERMQGAACTDFRGVHLVPGAGHWVQQERPAEVSALLAGFLRATRAGPRPSAGR